LGANPSIEVWNMHDCGGLSFVGRYFIGRREFGGSPMDQMTRRAFGAAGFALLLATHATFAQQQPSTVRCAAPSKRSMDRC
jgi:hypothetical protein